MLHETPHDPSVPQDPLREWYLSTIWGRRVHDDNALFEAMSLQVFQAGLTWKMMLDKRDGFRVAKLTNMPPLPPGAPGMAPEALSLLAIPLQVGTTQEVFGRADVRRACIPGAGGIMNARSAARFFAMLAQGGELDGVRLLSEERVRLFNVPRPPCDYDYVQGVPHNGSIGGFHVTASIGDAVPPISMAAAGRNPRTFGHPGAGGSIGWVDPDAHLAVAITHNRMFRASTPEENPLVPIGQAVRKALGVSG